MVSGRENSGDAVVRCDGDCDGDGPLYYEAEVWLPLPSWMRMSILD